MRSGGFLRKSQAGPTANDAPAGSGGPVFRPGPMPNPFRVEDALPALEPAEGKCSGCGAPLGVSATDCQVCGTSKVGPTGGNLGDPPTPLPAATVSRACIHCGAWTWPDAAFCHSCGHARAVAGGSPGVALPPKLID